MKYANVWEIDGKGVADAVNDRVAVTERDEDDDAVSDTVRDRDPVLEPVELMLADKVTLLVLDIDSDAESDGGSLGSIGVCDTLMVGVLVRVKTAGVRVAVLAEVEVRDALEMRLPDAVVDALAGIESVLVGDADSGKETELVTDLVAVSESDCESVTDEVADPERTTERVAVTDAVREMDLVMVTDAVSDAVSDGVIECDSLLAAELD